MALARRPEERGNSGLAIVGLDQPAVDAGWQPGQVFRHLGAGRFMYWTSDTPRPAGIDGTTEGNAYQCD
jgi:hypothetical protein